MPEDEVEKLSTEITKRNVFARHSRENNFYLRRVLELSDTTVIEVFVPGLPDDIYDEAIQRSDLIERLALLSTVFYIKRESLHHRVGIRSRPRAEMDFTIGPSYRYLKSRSKDEPAVKGIIIDQRFCRRFERLGFSTLAQFSLGDAELSESLSKSIGWLFASRLETDLKASVVKTVIALESLLIFSESESLARSLSERVAFMLSPVPDTRTRLSKIIKDFYNARSGIVHGGNRKLLKLSPNILESVDRLCLLLYLTIAANHSLWSTKEALQNWCDSQKWGYSTGGINFPYPENYLENALKLT